MSRGRGARLAKARLRLRHVEAVDALREGAGGPWYARPEERQERVSKQTLNPKDWWGSCSCPFKIQVATLKTKKLGGSPAGSP